MHRQHKHTSGIDTSNASMYDENNGKSRRTKKFQRKVLSFRASKLLMKFCIGLMYLFNPVIVSGLILAQFGICVYFAMTRGSEAWDSANGRLIPLISETTMYSTSGNILSACGIFVFAYLAVASTLLTKLAAYEKKVFGECIICVDRAEVSWFLVEVLDTPNTSDHVKEYLGCFASLKKYHHGTKHLASWFLFLCGFTFLTTTVFDLKDYGYYMHGFFACSCFILWYSFAFVWTLGDSSGIKLLNSCCAADSWFYLYQICDRGGICSGGEHLIPDQILSLDVGTNSIASIRGMFDEVTDIVEVLARNNKGTNRNNAASSTSSSSSLQQPSPPSPSDDAYIYAMEEIILRDGDSDHLSIDNNWIDVRESHNTKRMSSYMKPFIKKRRRVYLFRLALCVLTILTSPAVGWVIGFCLIGQEYASVPWFKVRDMQGVWDIMSFFQYANTCVILMFASTLTLELAYHKHIKLLASISRNNRAIRFLNVENRVLGERLQSVQ